MVLENVDSIKYLCVTITNDLKWNTHITNICTKSNRTLGFLRRNLFSCPHDVNKQLIKDLCTQSWNIEVLFGILILKVEKVHAQNCAARFVTKKVGIILSRKEV